MEGPLFMPWETHQLDTPLRHHSPNVAKLTLIASVASFFFCVCVPQFIAAVCIPNEENWYVRPGLSCFECQKWAEKPSFLPRKQKESRSPVTDTPQHQLSATDTALTLRYISAVPGHHFVLPRPIERAHKM